MTHPRPTTILLIPLLALAMLGCEDKNDDDDDRPGVTDGRTPGDPTPGGPTPSDYTCETILHTPYIYGWMVSARPDFEAVMEYDVAGPITDCTACLYAFEGEFCGDETYFRRTVTIYDAYYTWNAYDIGYVYTDAGEYWGLAFYNGHYTWFNNYAYWWYYYYEPQYTPDYYYYGALFR